MHFRKNKEILAFLCLALAGLAVLLRCVDLAPHVDQDFFFSVKDPRFREDRKASQLFARKDTQIIISAEGDLYSEAYNKKINALSQALSGLRGVTGVKSITHGPSNLKDAIESPFWSRLLVSDSKRASNLIVLLEDTAAASLVPAIEKIIKQNDSAGFRLKMSGVPYVVELIQRNLAKDVKVFSLLAFVLFSIVILALFRSALVLLGSLTTCALAFVMTMTLTSLLSIPVGILTANIATITFVLTLSPIVFLTFNWMRPAIKNPVRYTLPAAFWSMLTTLLGFLGLLNVPAKPLRELGLAGSIATSVTFLTVYSIYPAFLRLIERSGTGPGFFQPKENRLTRFLFNRSKIIFYVLLGVSLACLAAVPKIQKDPSLFSYFKKSGEISQGLAYIDRNGGSNPLILVVSLRSGEKLNTTQAYAALWRLQTALEKHESVGAVISLPVLMAQAKRAPLAFFLSWEWLLQILEQPKFGEIAKTFVTQDRNQGLFLLRMKEFDRKRPRLQVVEELKGIVRGQGFIPELTAGIYVLQGHLSKLVARSLFIGSVQLILIFCVIGWLVSRSVPIALSMAASVASVVAVILGAAAYLKIPLDTISAPAVNVAIGMGVDAMIHMTRYITKFHPEDMLSKQAWRDAVKYFWQPVATATAVIVLGFSIFLFSQFPPTQRFGASIVLGSVVAALSCFCLMPEFVARLSALSDFLKSWRPGSWPFLRRPSGKA